MDNYYSLLGLTESASSADIKRAFREKAKRLHPDIVGKGTEDRMRKLLAAYKILSDADRRFEYDRAYSRFVDRGGFDYRTFLRQRPEDPASQAKLVLFELFHLEEEDAIAVWKKNGGVNFPMEKYLSRDDWMDGAYFLADELIRRKEYYDAFVLLTRVLREERRKPYFHFFTEDVEISLKELVRLHLKPQVDEETWLSCMETLLELGFPPRDEARWLRSMAETLYMLGDYSSAAGIIREALKRDPALPNASKLRRKLNV
ncbi:MAG: J domain-containing protein [Treponema sp.]|nr:J domain-containing protein [Treponema sp.]